MNWSVRDSNPVKLEDFSLLQKHSISGGPPSLLFNEYRGSFLRVKWPQREVTPSPPSTAEVKNKHRNTSTPPNAFTACTEKLYLFTKYIQCDQMIVETFA
jgi:hypothetical protein